MRKKKEIESFKMPRYVQDVIPIKVLYKDGMAYMGEGVYTKMFALKDINYSAASGDAKETMLELYQECLNAFEVGVQTKITRWQQNQTKHNVVPFDIPYQLKAQKRGIQSFADDLGSANQVMMCVHNYSPYGRYSGKA